jgi:hypothetical protein
MSALLVSLDRFIKQSGLLRMSILALSVLEAVAALALASMAPANVMLDSH